MHDAHRQGRMDMGPYPLPIGGWAMGQRRGAKHSGRCRVLKLVLQLTVWYPSAAIRQDTRTRTTHLEHLAESRQQLQCVPQQQQRLHQRADAAAWGVCVRAAGCGDAARGAGLCRGDPEL